MPKHINSAYRVHATLSAACARPGNQQMWEVFAKVFEIQHPNGRKKIFEVNRMLDLLYDEIEKTRAQMKASNFSEDLYEPAFTLIEQRITPGLLFNDWHGYKAALEPILHTLKFCSEVLPHEEDLVSEEDLGAIREALKELEDVLQESELPDYVKAFIQQHISIIKKALRDYQVIGAKAFKTAMYEGYIQFVENEEIVTEYQQSEEIGLLGKAWNGVKKATSYTLGNEKFLTAGTKLAELGLKVAEHIDKTQK
ncbi:MAG TPA: hypothetical protein VF659_13765 [Pyrinomonadaceae bacterium]|jgi:hypothetical protein